MIKIQSPIVFSNTHQFKQENLPVSKPASTRPEKRELGAPGQLLSGGKLLSVDYNVDLAPPEVYNIYDRMRKSDGTISGLMAALKLPILNVDWRVKPGSDDESDKAIADYIEDALENMSTSFENVLYQILLYLDYGSMPFETVWDLDDDNLVYLRKLAPRLPKSILYWNVDDKGGLRSITQAAYSSVGYQQVDIPVEKLVVFINGQEGADFRGTSLLRPAYKHWFYKEHFYILDAIAKERRAIGVDVGTLKGNDIDDDMERDMEYALMGLHAHEKQFFVEQDERFTYRIEGLNGRPMPILDSVEHHDSQILRSILAEFIAVGTGGGGSYALSRDKSSFFTMSLNSIVKHVANVFNRYLIPKWVAYNWTVDKKNLPKLEYSRIETRDVDMLSNAIQRLQVAGFISPTTEDEESLRDTLEMPHVDREQEVTGIPINGASLVAITNLMSSVGKNEVTLDQARGILTASFPFLTTEQIEGMLGAPSNAG